MKFLNQSKLTSSWCETARYFSQNRHHPRVKSWGVVMVMDVEVKSQPCTTIPYTYNKALEGLGCCELPEPVQTHTILAERESDVCGKNVDLGGRRNINNKTILEQI